MSRSVLFLAASSLALAVAASLPAQGGKMVGNSHVDGANGFQIDPPEKWKMVPINPDERWIVAKYNCNRSYPNKGKGNAMEFTPEMRVLLFNEEKAKVKTETRQADSGTTHIAKITGYRGYEEYLKDDMKARGQGYFIADKKEEDVSGTKVIRYVVRCESPEVTIVYHAWQYRSADGDDIVVQFDTLEERLRVLEPEWKRAYASFKFIPKTGDNAAGHGVLPPLWVMERDRWKKMPPTERAKIRREEQDKQAKSLVEKVPQGWFLKESPEKRYTALSHADKKFTDRLLTYADAVRRWLDKSVGGLSDEYVLTGIVRVCADRDEVRSYSDSSSDYGSYNFNNREILTYHDVDAGSSARGQGRFAISLFQNYIADKDLIIAYYVPDWFLAAIGEYVGASEAKGKELQFKASIAENLLISEAERANQLKKFKELINASYDDWPKEAEPYWRYRAQLGRSMRFILGGSNNAVFKDFLNRYLKAVGEAGEEWRSTHKDEGGKAKTEEEEEAKAKERSKANKERDGFMLKKANAAVFGSLSEKDWDKLEKEWELFVKK